MAKHGKKFTAAAAQVKDRLYSIEEAIPLIQKVKFAKFDETVEMAMRLGVDPKHADQMVRGTVVLPHGLGKSKRVLAIAGADKQKEAQEAGADFVGGDEVVEKILGGWMDFDAVVATPDMMRGVGRLGKVLGPRGLMPNPKTGTVTPNVAQAIREIKAGKVEFRVDKTGIIHAPVGKTSFASESLIENAHALVDSVVKAKPSAAKGKYLKSVTVSSTMGPGVGIDTGHIDERQKALGGSMAVTRSEKEQELQELTSTFKGVDTAILVDYKGLDVPGATELRRQLRSAKAQYRVVKNTLAKRATKGHPAGGSRSALRGHDGDCLHGRGCRCARKGAHDVHQGDAEDCHQGGRRSRAGGSAGGGQRPRHAARQARVVFETAVPVAGSDAAACDGVVRNAAQPGDGAQRSSEEEGSGRGIGPPLTST